MPSITITQCGEGFAIGHAHHVSLLTEYLIFILGQGVRLALGKSGVRGALQKVQHVREGVGDVGRASGGVEPAEAALSANCQDRGFEVYLVVEAVMLFAVVVGPNQIGLMAVAGFAADLFVGDFHLASPSCRVCVVTGCGGVKGDISHAVNSCVGYFTHFISSPIPPSIAGMKKPRWRGGACASEF